MKTQRERIQIEMLVWKGKSGIPKWYKEKKRKRWVRKIRTRWRAEVKMSCGPNLCLVWIP